MNEQTQTQVGYVSPLKHICMTIGELPSSYIETMSYYEMLVWFVEFLRNQVIPVVNNNSEATEELQNLFKELQNYVNNYFDNLDVQDEINNKLDEMVEAGTLQEIIAEYLNSKAIFGFDSVANMKEATNLIDGSYARTLGYYSKNDGGSALYKIRTITNVDIVDNMFIISLNDESNQLIAELIENKININQLGAYGDGIHNDTTIFENAIEKLNNLSLVENKTYIVKNLVIDKYFNLYGNNATLKAIENCDYILKLTTLQNNFNGIIKDIIFDGNQYANDCILLDNNFRRILKNISVNNPINNGIRAINSCGGTRLYSINGKQNNVGTGTFLNIQGDDININMADFQNYKIGLYSNRNLYINEFHGYIYTDNSNILNDTKFIHMDGGRLIASNLYPDTQNYWFYVSNIGDYQIIGGNSWHNPDVTDSIISGTANQKIYCLYSTNSSHVRRLHLNNFSITSPSSINNIKFTNITGVIIDTTSTSQSYDSNIDYSEWLNTSYSILPIMATINTNETNNLRFKNSGNSKGQIFGTISFSSGYTDTNTITLLTLSENYQFDLNSSLSYHNCAVGSDFNSAVQSDVKLMISENKVVLHKLRATSLENKNLYIQDYISLINIK